MEYLIKSYKKYLLFEGSKYEEDLVISNHFENILKRINDEVSLDVLNNVGEKSSVSYVDISSSKENLSFVQSNKVGDILGKGTDPWKTSIRQEIKVGRLINKLTTREHSSKEIENFVNSYKAAYEYESWVDYFDVVSEGDVTKYYSCTNQVEKEGSTLYNSCMKGRDQQRFIESFFASNPDTIKTLVLRDKETPDKIIGRANLWYLTEPSGRVFMDRVYTSYDYLINIFVQYAVEHGYIYKSRQVYGGNVVPVIDNGVSKKIIMSAQMKPLDYTFFPYVDTLQFYNKETGVITNDTSKWHEPDWISLIHPGGGYMTKEKNYGYIMDYIGRIVHPHFVVHSNVDNCYIHRNDAVRLDYLNDWCTPERDIVIIDGQNYLKEDTYFDEIKKEYIVKK